MRGSVNHVPAITRRAQLPQPRCHGRQEEEQRSGGEDNGSTRLPPLIRRANQAPEQRLVPKNADQALRYDQSEPCSVLVHALLVVRAEKLEQLALELFRDADSRVLNRNGHYGRTRVVDFRDQVDRAFLRELGNQGK